MLWRLHIKPRPKDGKTHDDVIKYCMTNNIAGIGWAVDEQPKNLDHYISLAKAKHKGSPASIAFAHKPKSGDHIWTRDKNGIYYLGKVTGEWNYQFTEEAHQLDIPNQIPCAWKKIGNEEHVPGKVIACFRASRAFQAIPDDDVERFSSWLYVNNGTDTPLTDKPHIDLGSLFKMIGSHDCEDLVGLYVQFHYDYMLIASSCKRNDTIAYEYILKHKSNGKTAIAQVKQGYVPLDERLKETADEVFLFSLSGNIPTQSDKIKTISPEDLIDFCVKHPEILPDKIKNWLKYLSQ
ncbi:MAG: hypothetical protein EAZ74_00680 [Alphaproteobacteria bacterium]|nr:MAG: hypothetical protein EAY76_01265 [Alphaproteobacteria bacterium]TAF15947.1 MAG: hypothetical protein EAZ74_00680 [Alphaproteobacteria bacterium]TAF41936.1 MAG: hypothetical protein EAZ66_00470 [Alphaproteobacteria bacterium]TAF76761.1 MAG: hypothetical protein EAZ52_03135 [Alphaproteobacteria bacterium]